MRDRDHADLMVFQLGHWTQTKSINSRLHGVGKIAPTPIALDQFGMK